jgi:hypothetical protein
MPVYLSVCLSRVENKVKKLSSEMNMQGFRQDVKE